MYQKIIRRYRAEQGWLWIFFFLKRQIYIVQRKSDINYNSDGLLWIKAWSLFPIPFIVSMDEHSLKKHLHKSDMIIFVVKTMYLGP